MFESAPPAGARGHQRVRHVLLASPRSFCAGVEMAIKSLAYMVQTLGPPVFCYHEIVHNQSVVDQFRRAGVVFVDDIADVPPGAPLMLSAHGSAPDVIEAATERAGVLVDAVCPLVKKVHHELARRAFEGYRVVYAGHEGHDEALGTLAVAPEVAVLVSARRDVEALPDYAGPVAFLTQTTLGEEEWREILGATRERFGEVWLPSRTDLCFATTNRQAAVRAIAPRCDATVVIGSGNSSNTTALVEVAQVSGCPKVVRISSAEELPHGLGRTVGLTAGASTPERIVQETLSRLDPVEGVELVDVTDEDEYFPLPPSLRDLLRSLGAAAPIEADRSIAAASVLRHLAG